MAQRFSSPGQILGQRRKLNSDNQNHGPFLKNTLSLTLRGFTNFGTSFLPRPQRKRSRFAKLNRDGPRALAGLDEIRESDKKLFGYLQLCSTRGGRSIFSLIVGFLGLRNLVYPEGHVVAGRITFLGHLRSTVCEIDSVRHKIPFRYRLFPRSVSASPEDWHSKQLNSSFA